MLSRKLLQIEDLEDIYHIISTELEPYKENPTYSMEFIVEGTLLEPIIGIRYPGKKVKNRNLANSPRIKYNWANLFDFKVIPYFEGREIDETSFTYENILKDFEKNKKDSDEFWLLLNNVYRNNEVKETRLLLEGIETNLFLYVMKWLWIQEDFNYYGFKRISIISLNGMMKRSDHL